MSSIADFSIPSSCTYHYAISCCKIITHLISPIPSTISELLPLIVNRITILPRHSHLPTHANNHIQVWDIFATIPGLCILHLTYNVHAVHNLAEDNVLAIKEGCRDCSD